MASPPPAQPPSPPQLPPPNNPPPPSPPLTPYEPFEIAYDDPPVPYTPCRDGYVPITNETECLLAAQHMGKPYQDPHPYQSLATGCLYHANLVLFNSINPQSCTTARSQCSPAFEVCKFVALPPESPPPNPPSSPPSPPSLDCLNATARPDDCTAVIQMLPCNATGYENSDCLVSQECSGWSPP